MTLRCAQQTRYSQLGKTGERNIVTVNNLVQWIRLAPIFLCLALPAVADEDRWWPVQTMPKAIVRTTNQSAFPAPRVPYEMLVQSVAGLAAKGVNESRSDELV